MPLKRTLSLSLLTFYGLGTIIGAGIYALIGAVSKEAGMYTPYAFLVASIIALFTAGSYSELSSRFPDSAGSALYAKKAFNQPWITLIIGWLIVLTGLVSAATLTRGFVNYVQFFLTVPSYVTIILLIIVLGGITIIGIKESATTIMLMTFAEIFGLVMVVWYGKHGLTKIASYPFFPNNFTIWKGILGGSFIAFYAFFGFEDMVNVAEETKNPEKFLPLAIFIALGSATFIYLIVTFVTIFSLQINQLIESKAPLALIIQAQGQSPVLFTFIALISISNGILVQIIMASRLIYGMSKHKSAPQFFSTLSKKTQIPIYSTLFIIVAIIMTALWLPIDILASITSVLMLFVFMTMHLSLIVIKNKYPDTENFSVPIIIPYIGILLSIIFITMQFV